jgi:signal transduction histidine kinase
MSTDDPLPPGTEQRIAQFAELVATAIANAESRAELTASRARVVTTADESRRRIQRDLHDGAQQRLVHTVITLKLLKSVAPGGASAALADEALRSAEQATTSWSPKRSRTWSSTRARRSRTSVSTTTGARWWWR